MAGDMSSINEPDLPPGNPAAIGDVPNKGSLPPHGGIAREAFVKDKSSKSLVDRLKEVGCAHAKMVRVLARHDSYPKASCHFDCGLGSRVSDYKAEAVISVKLTHDWCFLVALEWGVGVDKTLSLTFAVDWQPHDPMRVDTAQIGSDESFCHDASPVLLHAMPNEK
jgi:hypothetical protein